MSNLNDQLVNDEKIVEAMIEILVTNEGVECQLIPCLNAIIKVLNRQGAPVIRNKVLNSITFLLKSMAQRDTEALNVMFPSAQIKPKQSILMLIGCLRLLLKSNRGLMKCILRGLVQKEDAKSNQMLKKQVLALKQKAATD